MQRLITLALAVSASLFTVPAFADMSAGGLEPPPAIEPDPFTPPTGTAADLARSDDEDSGRGLQFFFLDGEVGLQHLGLQTFKANDLLDASVVKTSQTGLAYGAGLGLRLLFWTIGARFRLGNFSDYQLWTLNLELGTRIPIGPIEPYFMVGGGYASLGSFDAKNVGSQLNQAGVAVTGYNARIGGGLDYYLSNVVSLGASLTGDVLFMSREKVSGLSTGVMADPQAQALSGDVYAADGSSIGASGTVSLVLGFHF